MYEELEFKDLKSPARIPVFEVQSHIARLEFLLKERNGQMEHAATAYGGYQLFNNKVLQDARDLEAQLARFIELCEKAVPDPRREEAMQYVKDRMIEDGIIVH